MENKEHLRRGIVLGDDYVPCGWIDYSRHGWADFRYKICIRGETYQQSESFATEQAASDAARKAVAHYLGRD